MTEIYAAHIHNKVCIMAVLLRMTPVLADYNLVHLIYRYTKIRPMHFIYDIPEKYKRTPRGIYMRIMGGCLNCYSMNYYAYGCKKCFGLKKRYIISDDIELFDETSVFTVDGVKFSCVEIDYIIQITVVSRYGTMQFNTYRANRALVKVIGDLAYMLTSSEFTILNLRHSSVLYQWHDHRHDKEYPGTRVRFEFHPRQFDVMPNGTITILDEYRTYHVVYD